MWPEEVPSARKIAPLTSEIRDLGHAVQYVKLQVWTNRDRDARADCLVGVVVANGRA